MRLGSVDFKTVAEEQSCDKLMKTREQPNWFDQYTTHTKASMSWGWGEVLTTKKICLIYSGTQHCIVLLWVYFSKIVSIC